MAQAVAAAIARGEPLLAEAGTGTGKTFAYLVPALLYGGKVIVSTGTKTLQDQLFDRDLPLVRDALAVPATLALLKGRSNYVCHHHLERTRREGLLRAREDARHLERIVRFARETSRGDRAELADVPESASVWPLVTSTRDNCLGSKCSFHDDCFVMKARRDALDADVVVVNHHLFFADVALRDEGLAELLPACNTVILDEAHQLPDTATLFFGEQTSSGALAELARDSELAARTGARDVPALAEASSALVSALRRLRLTLGAEPSRFSREVAASHTGFGAELEAFALVLDRLREGLAAQAERSEDLAAVARRASDAAERLAHWRDDGAERDGHEWIRWVDAGAQGFQLHASPMSVADLFRRQVDAGARSWILTSATLSVAGDFAHFAGQLGLADAVSGSWESPFDYATQALLYVPRGLPPPNTPEHTRAVVDLALPVLKASRGRAFMLFTTLRALGAARERLAEAIERDSLEFVLLVQGDMSKTELLARFRSTRNAILLGSASFWEGVDVPGDALSAVVIDKLPFAPPDDPLLAARLAKLADAGRNPFIEWQLPQAAISLKQGAGRLIRAETDRGVLMLCDPRLVDRPYGRKIWRSLPPMRRTREIADVEAFFNLAIASPDRLPNSSG